MHINITIPTLDRADGPLQRAIDGALGQTHLDLSVTVIDDGSTDDTPRVLRSYASDSRFGAIRLGRNVGTARAKNVGLFLGRYDAITFHDSDDVPRPDKAMLQGRALAIEGLRADPILDWEIAGQTPGSDLQIDVVHGAYDLVKLDGSVQRIDSRITLVDDFFPQLQFPSRCVGDWILPNAALYRRRVFESLGGYLESIEEDRELRNRVLAAGFVHWFVAEPLMTKYEMPDSLTVAESTNYDAEQRRRDRDEVWRRCRRYAPGLRGIAVAREEAAPVDLADLVVEEVIRPERFAAAADIPATDATRNHLASIGEPRRQPVAAE